MNSEKIYMDIIADLKPYKTACESINKDNPMAVVENLEEMEHFLNEVAHHDLYGEELINYLTGRAIKLLTKIQLTKSDLLNLPEEEI